MKIPSKVDLQQQANLARKHITPDRIIGVVALAIIPCMMTDWLQLPVLKQLGFDISFSVPNLINICNSSIESAQNYEELSANLQNMIHEAQKFIEEHRETIDVVKTLFSKGA